MPNPARKARSSGWSRRYAPPLPVQLGLWPHDVTATTWFEFVSSNVGPPESPKHVPPVAVLFERTIYVSSGLLFKLLSLGSDFMRVSPPDSLKPWMRSVP